MPDPAEVHFGAPVPVLRVANVERSVAYYCDRLGFALRWSAGGDFACVARDHCTLFLTSDNQSQPRMWVYVGVADARALHQQLSAAGACIRNPPNNFWWGLEMQVEDLDGNVLRFGSDHETGQPPGIWRDADGNRWRILGPDKYERVE